MADPIAPTDHPIRIAPGATGVVPDPAPAERADALLAWLSERLGALHALGRRRASSDAGFWEPFLAEVVRCKDAEACRHLAGRRAYADLRSSFAVWFSDYACRRDLERAEPLCLSYLRSEPADGLSRDMRRFLTHERTMIEDDFGEDADPPRPRSAVFVGCGASPETLLHYATSGRGFARVLGLDSRREAAARASETIRRLDLSHAEARVGDGRRFGYGPYDLVHVANFVAPKADVLSQVAATAAPGTRVVVRVPTFLEPILCDAVDLARCPGFEVRDRRSSHYCSMESVLLRVI